MKILQSLVLLNFLISAPFLGADEEIKDGISFDKHNLPHYFKNGKEINLSCCVESETELRYVMLDKLYLEMITRFPVDEDIMKHIAKTNLEKDCQEDSK